MHIRSRTARWTALWAACALTTLGAGPVAAEAGADDAGATASSSDASAGSATPEYTDIDAFFEEALGEPSEPAASDVDAGEEASGDAGQAAVASGDEAGPAPVSAATAAGAGAVDAGPAGVEPSTVDAASGDDENVYARAGEITLDALLMRPLGAVATVVGSGFYVVSWPVLAVSGGTDSARDAFVVERARYTFDRPLGRF